MLTSIQNNQVKEWKKLHKRKERSKKGLFLIEGFHLIEEAFKSQWKIKAIIIREDISLPEEYIEIPLVTVNEVVFQYLAQTQTPQGIIGVVEKKIDMKATGNKILMIDRVQDPGNLGTMIRTADAAGFSSIILGDGTVDVYNDKVIRATQGSLFHLDIVEAILLKEIISLKEKGYEIWATALEDATYYDEVLVSEKIVLVLGNEGTGVDSEVLNAASHIVTIPIYGQAESLNVSISAGILMYHLKG